MILLVYKALKLSQYVNHYFRAVKLAGKKVIEDSLNSRLFAYVELGKLEVLRFNKNELGEVCHKFVETINKTKEMEVEIEGSRCRPTDVFLYEVKWERAFPANKHY